MESRCEMGLHPLLRHVVLCNWRPCDVRDGMTPSRAVQGVSKKYLKDLHFHTRLRIETGQTPYL